MTDYATTFITEGLQVNETVIIVVTAQHREELPKTLPPEEMAQDNLMFFVDGHCMDLDIGAGREGDRFWAMCCVQCGDMIDETILRNRQSRPFPAHGSRHSVECERSAA